MLMCSRKTVVRIVVCFFVALFLFGCKKENSPAAITSASPTNGQARMDSKGIEQVWISSGSFLMGSSDSAAADVVAGHPPAWVLGELPSEQPRHEVRLTAGYWFDKYEVTNQAYQRFVSDSGYYKSENWSAAGKAWLASQLISALPLTTGSEVPNQPRVNVTWYEAEAYANWRGGHLPTEAEWEFAARGPNSLIYPWGNTIAPVSRQLSPFSST